MTLTVLHGFYHVRLLDTEERTEGGILLPETVRDNFTDAVVLAAGPGRTWRSGMQTFPSAVPGDRVIFRPAHFWQSGSDPKEGFVNETDLVGTLPAALAHAEVVPANGYLLVEPPAAEKESAGGIILIERAPKRPNCGFVLNYGPGAIRLKGDLAGTRRPVETELNETDLLGRKVYWDHEAEIVELTGDSGWVAQWLVAARDVLALEVEA
jgi:chaperonin GroES